MKVYLLDNGWLTIDQASLTWNLGGSGEVRIPNYAVYIDHPEGRVLLDTGMDREWFARVLPSTKPEQAAGQRVVDALARLGVLPDQIDIVVNSHLHPEHCGGNRFFPNSRFILSREELRHCFVPDDWERHAYDRNLVDLMGAKRTLLDLQNSEYEVLPGITLFDTPGHSAGHLSALVRPAGRAPILFPFDAAYSPQVLRDRIVMGLHHDPVAARRSFARIESIARAAGAEIFFPHDPAQYAGFQFAPEGYGA